MYSFHACTFIKIDHKIGQKAQIWTNFSRTQSMFSDYTAMKLETKLKANKKDPIYSEINTFYSKKKISELDTESKQVAVNVIREK